MKLLRGLLAVGALIGIMASGVFADELKVGGGGAAINSIFKPIEAPFEKASGINLVLLQSTPKNGIIDLWKGSLDAATAAVSLEGMVSGAQKDGVQVDASALKSTEVGKNLTVVFVHKDNPVSSLSKDQLKGIFTGKIANWKEVGGKDSPIIVVWGKNSPGQNALFTKVILDGEAVTKDILETTDYAGIKENVASNPEGIGIDPLGMADGTVKAIKPTPEVSSPVIVVTKGAPSPNIQKLIDFIKGEGQKYIKQ
ncbi:MAG: substrate-binding domain-containing protein [Nitrospirota bacterium]